MDHRDKIMGPEKAAAKAASVRQNGGRVVFTNGCFDILHAGHVRYLAQARAMGDFLVLGLNSDQSVKSLGKGADRPLVPQEQRAEVMAALASVDAVVIFDRETPAELIETVKPDILVKGGDWPVESIVGADFVLAAGGQVHSIPLVGGLSTTALAKRIRQAELG